MPERNQLVVVLGLEHPDFGGNKLAGEVATILRDLADDIEACDKSLLSGSSLTLYAADAKVVGEAAFGHLD